VFTKIATSSSKNWDDPAIGRRIDNAFKEEAGQEIPEWAGPMLRYDKVVEWMRRQHWKNNKKKLAEISG